MSDIGSKDAVERVNEKTGSIIIIIVCFALVNDVSVYQFSAIVDDENTCT